jgi:hypothetical protein
VETHSAFVVCFANGGFDDFADFDALALLVYSVNVVEPNLNKVKRTSTVASMRSTAFRLLSHRNGWLNLNV